jgi:hypothetical protein
MTPQRSLKQFSDQRCVLLPSARSKQADLQAIRRVRDQLVRERTSVVNHIRAFLLEYGLAVATGRKRLLSQLPAILEDAENAVSHVRRTVLGQLQTRSRLSSRSLFCEVSIWAPSGHVHRCRFRSHDPILGRYKRGWSEQTLTFGTCLTQPQQRAHHNVAAVSLANKLARIA